MSRFTKEQITVSVKSSKAIPEAVRSKALSLVNFYWQQGVDRRAHELVEQLKSSVLLRSDILDGLRSDATIAPEIRDRAIVFAEGMSAPDPRLLNVRAWQVVAPRDKTLGDYRRALRWAEEASRRMSDDYAVLNTLGVAQYRARAYEQALVTLRRCDEEVPGDPHNLAFLAMTQYQLGQHDAALETIEKLREALKVATWAGDAECQAFLTEVQQLLDGAVAGNPK